jgi:hypothetical protein
MQEICTYVSGQYKGDEGDKGFQELDKHVKEREGDRENRNR